MGFFKRWLRRDSSAVKAVSIIRSEGMPISWAEPSQVPAHQNSAVLACVKWACRAFPEAPLVVERSQGDTWEQVRKHDLTKLLDNPNPYYGGNLLWSGTILSLMCDGNAYWHKLRGSNGSGSVQELWYLPHGSVTPVCRPGDAYISHYRYSANGRSYELAPDDVVHFRDGIDPECPTRGLSPLKSVAREILSDNEIAQYTHSILRKMGIIGLLITPKSDQIMIGDDQGRVISEKIKAMASGDNRGEPLVLDAPLDVTSPGFSPKDMQIDIMRQMPESRICAVLGIHPTVVGLSVGLEHSTFSNMREAREAAWESFLLPLQSLCAGELDAQLLDELGDSNSERCRFDTSTVRALAEDENSKAERFGKAYQYGGIKRSEYRAALGFDSSAEDELYCTDISSGVAVASSQAEVIKSLKARAQSRKEAYDALRLDEE